MNKLSGLALAVLAGAGTAVQARINGELGRRLGDGIAAATISFGVGMVILICMLPWILPGLRKVRVALRAGTLRWWQMLGGLCGAFLVATQGLTVASIGVAVFTVAVVAGQSASSLAVDRAGLAPGGAHPVTFNRGLAAILCVIAVVIAVGDRLGDARAIGLAVLPALAGIGIAWQQGMNGFVRQAADGALPATFVNFAVGTIALVVVMLFHRVPATLPTEPWLYLGGPLGIAFIAVAAAIVRRIGVLLLGLGTIAGQISGALVIDSVAPTAGRPDLLTFLGATLALVAVALATRPQRP
ncbi:DMT family transporter [Allorhizocola rhizosphaerae]|uniref:DMT family transporter n=1 Tax=Allorhizocola rhizosphaerae TaxID=1872709 RepID=UPI001FE96E71|nr:DMT family transporter [Allorhizocola rhizosphaerae]